MSIDQITTPVTLYEGETWVYQCPLSRSRVSLKLETIAKVGSTGQKSTVDCSEGELYLSTRRLVYVASPQAPTRRYHVAGKGDRDMSTVSIPLDRIRDSRLHQPWLGPSGWVAVVVPVAEGGMEPSSEVWQARVGWKEGGVYEFAEAFEKAERARKAGQAHVEDLPQYSET